MLFFREEFNIEHSYEAKRVSLRWGLECFRLKSKLMQFECGLIANFFFNSKHRFYADSEIADNCAL